MILAFGSSSGYPRNRFARAQATGPGGFIKSKFGAGASTVLDTTCFGFGSDTRKASSRHAEVGSAQLSSLAVGARSASEWPA
jgi:hypothetical protein